MESDGKIKLLHRNGFTNDIIRACVDEWNNGWRNCMQFSQQFKRNSAFGTCRAVFDFLVGNIRYRVDPDGEQWIRTPARLLRDGTGDCKSYSIFTASVLSCLGIECVMRFVSYDSDNYTHVYVVAFDEYGREVKIDAVAYVQCGIPFNRELEYKKKKDMRGTKISRLSGIGEISDELHQEFFDTIKGGRKMNYIYCQIAQFYFNQWYNAVKRQLTENERQQDHILRAASLAIERFGENNSDLTTAGYVIAKRAAEKNISPFKTNEIMSEISSYVNNSVNEATFIVSPEFQEISAPFMDWWQNFIVNYNRVGVITGKDEEIAKSILANALFFLYTVIDNKHLSKTALSKKEAQEEYLANFIAESGISYESALLLVQSGIILDSETTVEDFFKQFSGKKTASINGFDWSSLTDIIDSVSDSFSKVYDSITSGKGTKAPEYIPGYRPQQSDFNSNTLLWILGLGALGAGIYAFKNNKKGKRK